MRWFTSGELIPETECEVQVPSDSDAIVQVQAEVRPPEPPVQFAQYGRVTRRFTGQEVVHAGSAEVRTETNDTPRRVGLKLVELTPSNLTAPIQQMVIKGRRALNEIFKIIAHTPDRQFERRTQGGETGDVDKRPDRRRRDQNMDLPANEIDAGAQPRAIGELLIYGQVERLGTEALVGILAGDEFETVDEIVCKRVTRRKKLPLGACPVEAKAPSGVPNGLPGIRVQQALVDFRPIGKFLRKSGQPPLDQSPDRGICRRRNAFARQRDEHVVVHEPGFPCLLSGHQEREPVRAHGPTETEAILIAARRQHSANLEERAGIEPVVVVGSVELHVVGIPTGTADDPRTGSHSPKFGGVVLACCGEFRNRDDLRTLAVQGLHQGLGVDQVDLDVLVAACAF